MLVPNRLTAIVIAAGLQRFGYYGIRSLLIVYLTAHLQVSDHQAGQIYGLFYGSLFLTSLVGGALGDKSCGYVWTGSLGLILIVIGALCLSISSASAFLIGLLLYSIGFGLFDPNMNAVVGEQYEHDANLRSAAYTILYTGINIGAMSGPLLCGYVAVRTNTRYGFLVSGVASLISLLAFACYGAKEDTIPARKLESKETPEVSILAKVSRPLSLIVLLAVMGVVFWAVFDQLGSSITLLAQRYVNRSIWSFELPAGYVQAINPLFVIMLGPIFSLFMSQKSSSRGHESKFGALLIGLLLLGSGFGLLAIGSIKITSSNTESTISWSWILISILFATIGELLFAPVSLSLVSGLSPSNKRAFILGAWSATFGIGAYLSGTMSGLMNSFKTLSRFFGTSAVSCWITALMLSYVILTHRWSSRRITHKTGSAAI